MDLRAASSVMASASARHSIARLRYSSESFGGLRCGWSGSICRLVSNVGRAASLLPDFGIGMVPRRPIPNAIEGMEVAARAADDGHMFQAVRAPGIPRPELARCLLRTVLASDPTA